MPVEPNPNVEPPSLLARAWRYMNFPKFVSLIARRELYLSNLEALAGIDPHEGLLAEPNYRHRQWSNLDDLTDNEKSEIGITQNMNEEQLRIQFESHRNSREYWLRRRFYDRRSLFVNSWHLNEYESAAMWAMYMSADGGIAITSTFERIVGALKSFPKPLFAGKVQYLDYYKEKVDNTFVLPLTKRISYAFENELRIVHWDLEITAQLNNLCERLSQETFNHLYRRKTGPINWNLIENDVKRVPFAPGIYVPLDLDILIERIHISPNSPQWILEIVRSVCAKYGIEKEIIRSDLLSAPVR